MDYTKKYWSYLKTALNEKLYGGRSDLYPVKDIPHIIAAAWHDPIGDIYTGDDHMSAAINAGEAGSDDANQAFKTNDFYDYLRKRGWKDGFLTSDEVWVSREDAKALARKAKQIKTDNGTKNLDSYDVISYL